MLSIVEDSSDGEVIGFKIGEWRMVD